MKEDNPLNQEYKNGENRLSLSRREFLEAVGGGIIIFFSCGDLTAQERRPPTSLRASSAMKGRQTGSASSPARSARRAT